MGLNVKKVLVILKCPKRGTFLLSREKLQKQNKQTKRDLSKNMWFIISKIHTHQCIPLFYHHWRVGCRHHQQEWNHQDLFASQLWHLLQCWWWHLCHCRRDCHLLRILFNNRKQCLYSFRLKIFWLYVIHSLIWMIKIENILTLKLKSFCWCHFQNLSLRNKVLLLGKLKVLVPSYRKMLNKKNTHVILITPMYSVDLNNIN